jgi:alkanesulfonate monooxygenase SsuD/methylene tetrahydromethanopterin reductase-like flavin-dependent oxidoreductase (luciferase family)
MRSRAPPSDQQGFEMKFSILYEGQTVDTREAKFALFHQMIEQSFLAEEVGFDCVWAVEHTALAQYAHMRVG